MTESPKVIWATMMDPDCARSGVFVPSDEYPNAPNQDAIRYIRADAPELVALVETLRNAGTACLHGSGEAWGMRLSESPLGREIIARMDAANAALAKWEALTK